MCFLKFKYANKTYYNHLKKKHNVQLANELLDCNTKLSTLKKRFKKIVNSQLPFKANLNIPCFISSIKRHSDDNFSVVHLNLNSLRKKKTEIFQLLDQRIVDILMLNETRLDELTDPLSNYKHKNYNILRLDRSGNSGGGLAVYIKKEYSI